MELRINLHTLLQIIIGSKNVYFQPPSAQKMGYPCIRYEYSSSDTVFADDIPYTDKKQYQLTIIDRDPDSLIPDKIAKLPACSFVRYYTVDNLNHYVYKIFPTGLKSLLYANIINASLLEDSIYLDENTGEKVSDGGWVTTLFIPVIEGITYILSGDQWSRVCFFNSDQNFISGKQTLGAQLVVQSTTTGFVRVSFRKSTSNVISFKLQEITTY